MVDNSGSPYINFTVLKFICGKRRNKIYPILKFCIEDDHSKWTISGINDSEFSRGSQNI